MSPPYASSRHSATSNVIFINITIYFSKSSPHHQDLLSFPTRRSSDLAARAGCDAAARRPASPPARGARRTAPRARSEEHTSELQSRPHLVCRLLLEKKKKGLGRKNHTIGRSTVSDDRSHRAG